MTLAQGRRQLAASNSRVRVDHFPELDSLAVRRGKPRFEFNTDQKRVSVPFGDIASFVLKENLRLYQTRGFKDLRFGMSEAEVSRMPNGDTAELPDGRQLFFFVSGRSIGYKREYDGDNQTYVSKIRELFGPADKENISEAKFLALAGTLLTEKSTPFSSTVLHRPSFT